jgi:hypothetical protein
MENTQLIQRGRIIGRAHGRILRDGAGSAIATVSFRTGSATRCLSWYAEPPTDLADYSLAHLT